ncbi:HAD hydrolase-like protein [Salinicoccus hispanicus]|uniref:HAD hydrolase-like protein n=1 Tax=Salinicoccus hispanicus TaxID=157225 RepID=A0A6N8TWP7_9STAP|nr:HAD hydrolase-like protein [Salinicoccus hispanicus]MXQ50123.1 HAD hydrolase-like protein [Salinicoccus hispanicus]
MKKAVFFDMDGTLYRTELILELSLTQTLERLDAMDISYIEYPVDRFKEIMGVPTNEVWKHLLASPNEEDIRTSNDILQENLVANINARKGNLYKEVEVVLTHIKKQGYNIYIVSNGDEAYLDAIYKKHGLEGLVDGVHSINSVTTSNKSDLVRKVIESEKVDIGYMVGDRASDFKAGKENGLEVVGCNFYFAVDEELKEADHVIDSLEELKQLIN